MPAPFAWYAVITSPEKAASFGLSPPGAMTIGSPTAVRSDRNARACPSTAFHHAAIRPPSAPRATFGLRPSAGLSATAFAIGAPATVKRRPYAWFAMSAWLKTTTKPSGVASTSGSCVSMPATTGCAAQAGASAGVKPRMRATLSSV